MDSQKDNQLFDTRLDEIAQAIADGIMDTLNTEEASALSMTSSPSAPWSSFQTEAQGAEADAISRQPLYRVQVGAFHNLQNAVQLEQELKRLGYNTWIVTV